MSSTFATPHEPQPEGRGVERFFLDTRVVLAMIVLNAAVLTALAFPDLHHEPTLEAIDHVFTTYFVIEALLKIRYLTMRGYLASGWNRFDFTIVVLSLPSYAELFLDLPDLSFLLLLRVARVVKFFRFIRFVPNIANLLDGARRAARSSVFVVLAFFVFNFVIALLSCHFFSGIAPDYFGNPIVSFYSIFKVFTVEGWYEIPDTISADLAPPLAFAVRLYFMSVVVSGGLFGLSLVNAIFVDEMLRNENDLLEARLEAINAKLDALMAAQHVPSPPGSDAAFSGGRDDAAEE